MRRTRILSGIAVLLVAGAGVALLDGEATTPHRSRTSSDVGALDAATGVSSGAAGMADGTSSGGGAAREALAAPSGPRIVKTASLTVSVKSSDLVQGASAKANAIADRHGGYVSATEAATGDEAESSLTLRVPVATFNAALGELRELGEVSGESLGGNDVTAALVDLDARLRSLRAQEGALNALMGKARTVGETLQVAQAVNDVRTQIEQLAAQQKSLADQADFATITVRVVGPGGVTNREPSPDPQLVKAVSRAASGALAVVSGAVVVIGYAAPTALIAALAYGLWRLANRRGLGPQAGEA